VLKPEQKAIVAVTRHIDRLLINQNGVDHPARLDRLLPISAVASEVRDLASGHGANLARTHCATICSKPVSWTTPAAKRPRSSSITSIFRPAERYQTITHGILQRAALAIVKT
jgi:hypothetical protein